ncbi:MAG TPA: histidine kinase, partial [Roseiflexaceae bacterium]|nr:histidine kinase [Roseiflexaceae bacterium]
MRQRFGTIRWKLAGAYIVVSLVLALTLVAMLVGVLLWLLNSRIILGALAEVAAQQAQTFQRPFEAPERSPERLGAQLATLTAAMQRQPGPIPFGDTTNTTETRPAATSNGLDFNAQLVVAALIDPDGRVITTTLPMSYATGALLVDLEPAAARNVIEAAARGVTDTTQLAAWIDPAHQPIMAAPIVGGDGRVLGALYLRLTALPSTQVILSDLLPVLLTSLLPWLAISAGVGLLYAWVAGRGFSRRLKRLTVASAALASGDLAQRVDDRSADEIGQLARQFNSMADQLTTNMRSLRLLADQNAQLAEQAAQLATVEERNRLARELHDSVSQELFSLTMLAAATRRVLDRNPATAAAQLTEIETMARQALQETRGLIFALRPAMLDDRGLGPALCDLVAASRERQGLEVELRI